MKATKEKLNKISNLLKILTESNNNNIVIGGSAALLFHGLNLDKQPEDFDIIIYNPTQLQYEKLETFELFTLQNQVPSSTRRSYKMRINDVLVDILIEKNLSLPENLLKIEVENRLYFIQSINNIIAARKTYCNPLPRLKDLVSCIKLKEKNFNLLD